MEYINKVTKEKINFENFKLKQKIIEQELELKKQELELLNYKELSYEEVEKNESIYIFSTDKENIYKCGLTKFDINKRKKQLQTGCVDDIKILYEYKTHNSNILEKIIHYILDDYRCHSNREHFRCKLDYLKMIIQITGNTVNTLKSTFDNITEKEIIQSLLGLHVKQEKKVTEPIEIKNNKTIDDFLKLIKQSHDSEDYLTLEEAYYIYKHYHKKYEYIDVLLDKETFKIKVEEYIKTVLKRSVYKYSRQRINKNDKIYCWKKLILEF